MDNFIYINACKTTLAEEITNTQTTIQVSNPGRFPASIPLGQVLVLTIHPDGLPSTQEIVHCTAISSDVLTVVRGAQSTAAVPWPEGTVIGAYLTAEMLAQIADDVRGHAGSGGSAHALATTVAAGFMSAANVVKLAGIQAEATKYIHPITHDPSIIAQNINNRFVTDAEKADWNAAKNHADSPHAPADAQKNSDITKPEIEAKLTGTLTSHSHTNCDTVDGFHAQKTPAVDKIPVAGPDGKLDADWLPPYPAAGLSTDMGHNNIGSLCFAGNSITTQSVEAGGVYAGSNLKPGVISYYDAVRGNALSGTWRCLGTYYRTEASYARLTLTLWQRIA